MIHNDSSSVTYFSNLFIFICGATRFISRPNDADCADEVTDSSLALAVSPLDDEPGNRGISRRPYQRTLSPDNYAGQASSFHGASTNAINNAPLFRSTGRSLNVLPSKNNCGEFQSHG